MYLKLFMATLLTLSSIASAAPKTSPPLISQLSGAYDPEGPIRFYSNYYQQVATIHMQEIWPAAEKLTLCEAVTNWHKQPNDLPHRDYKNVPESVSHLVASLRIAIEMSLVFTHPQKAHALTKFKSRLLGCESTAARSFVQKLESPEFKNALNEESIAAVTKHFEVEAPYVHQQIEQLEMTAKRTRKLMNSIIIGLVLSFSLGFVSASNMNDYIKATAGVSAFISFVLTMIGAGALAGNEFAAVTLPRNDSTTLAELISEYSVEHLASEDTTNRLGQVKDTTNLCLGLLIAQ